MTLFRNCVILRINKGGQINFVLLGHRPNKAFLVPDSCRPTKNDNSISADVTDDTIENN